MFDIYMVNTIYMVFCMILPMLFVIVDSELIILQKKLDKFDGKQG